MRLQSLLTITFISAMGLTFMPAQAQPDQRGQENNLAALALSAAEQTLIREYYEENGVDQDFNRKHKDKRKSLPPGLQKKAARGEPLPPGWQKKIRRGEVVPESIYGNRRQLPPRLLERLPPQPSGTRLYRLDNEVVRVISATRVLADAFGL